ncbi:MAG TPA: hypothetical protein VF253_04080 [Candidatus Limnocylindrales bacterium]
MSHESRRLASLALTPVLLVSVVACSSGGAAPSSAPSVAPSGGSASPSDEPSPTAGGGIDHKTGAADILLRYDEGGGFMMAGYAAAQAPIFTLYGDGTVIFRNPMKDPPAPQGSTMPFSPFRTAKLTEEQIVDVLTAALGEGGLAAARPNYENNMVTDVGTTVFTIDAGGIKKSVSIYALGMDLEPTNPDIPARAAFKKLADRLADFDQGGSIETAVYEPAAYRASLMESPGMVAPDLVAWPWPDLTVADFKPDADPNGLQFPHKTMTADEVAKLGIEDYQGGFFGTPLKGSDEKLYTVAVRPILPGDPDA